MEPHARRLSTHQKAVLIQVLLTFPDQQLSVCYDPSANDARDFAQDFLTIFKVIGWEANEGTPLNTANGDPAGLTLVVKTEGSLPPSAEALRDALRIYGIEVATICDPACNVKPGGFILAVGPGDA
jgi:hypothetical protein